MKSAPPVFSVQTTGTPQAIASEIARPKPSAMEGSANMVTAGDVRGQGFIG